MDDIFDLLERSRLLMNLKRYRDAEKKLAEALAIEPTNAEVLLLFARCKFYLNKLAESKVLVNQALAQDALNAEALALLAEVMATQDNPEAAGWTIKQALAIDSYNPGYMAQLSRYLVMQGDEPAGVQVAMNALKINPENVPALAALGWAKAELESYDESLDAFHAGLSIDPNNSVLLHHIGTVLSDTGHAEGARAMFLDALRSDPNYDDAAINIAGLQYRTTLLYRFHYLLVSLFRDSHISRILFFCGAFLFLQSIAEPSWENHTFWGKLLVGTAWFFLLILLAVFIVPAAGNLPVIFEGKYRHLYTGKAKLKTVLIFLLYIASIGCLAAMLFSNGLAARSFMYASLILLLSSLVVQALLGSGQTLWGSVIMLFLAGCLFTWLYLTSKGVIGYGNGFYGGWLGIGSNVVTLGFAGFKKFSD